MPWITPDVSLHRELELLVQAGIDEDDVIVMTTRNGAEGLSKDLWKRPVMMRRIKAKYSKGVFVPQESLDLEEGKEVVMSLGEIITPRSAVESLGDSAGGWIGMHDPEQLKRKIYEARIAGSRQKPEL